MNWLAAKTPKSGEFCFGTFGEFYFGIDTRCACRPPRDGRRVRRLPVRRKALSRQGQNPRGQIPNPDARKDQEAVVLHKPPEIRRPRPGAPADERVARLRMPAGGLEADPAQTAAPLRDDPAAKPRARRQGRPLRMPERHHRPPGPDVRRAGRRLEPDRPEIAERRLDPRIRNRVRSDGPAQAPRAAGSRTPRSAAKPGSAQESRACGPPRRPTAEPAPTARKTKENAEMSAPGAEPALLPREKALRKPPGKPTVRENRRLFWGACQFSWLKWPRHCLSKAGTNALLAVEC